VPLPVAWIGGIVALVVACFAIPAAITARRLGRVTLEAGPSPCPRGGEMAVRVTLHPRKDVAPTEVSATLAATERSVKGSGKQRNVREVTVHAHAVRLEGPPVAAAGKAAVYAGVIPVPENAPPSFEAGSHAVLWKLQVKIALPGLMDADWTLEPKVG